MILAYTTILGVRVCYINIEGQKIEISIYSIHNMMLANFWLKDK